MEKIYRIFFVNGNGWRAYDLLINRKTGVLKVFYRSGESAEKAIGAMSKRYDTAVSAYKCVFCAGYHLGNSRRAKDMRRYRYEIY